eukprot:g27558.t1
MMQEFKARNEAKKAPESDGPMSGEHCCKSSKDRLTNSAQSHSAGNPGASSREGEREGGGGGGRGAATSPGFTRSRQMGGLTEISPSAAVPRLPNTGRRPGQEQGVGAGGPLPPGEWGGGGGGGGSFGSDRTGSGRRPAMDEASLRGSEDEHYLDFLACSDVLRDEDKARWEHRLDCPCPPLLPGNCRTQDEAPNVAVTGACPQGPRGAGTGRPAAGAILAANGSDPGHSPPPHRAMDGGTPSPGALRHTESRLAPNHRQHPVRPPPYLHLGKNSTPSAQPGAGDRGRPGEVQMGSEDNTDHRTVR